MQADVPLFPLGAVLFPGGVLPLRLFEARYLDMARECMQDGVQFGVCLITRGREVGPAADHQQTGCLARIADWEMEQLGVLQVRAIGTARFRVLARRVQKDGLVRADIQPLADDPAVQVPDDLAGCATLARRIVEDLERRAESPLKKLVEPPFDYDSSAWVANRLCEFMPIPAKARQMLMELDDPLVRLKLVHQFLQQRQVL